MMAAVSTYSQKIKLNLLTTLKVMLHDDDDDDDIIKCLL